MAAEVLMTMEVKNKPVLDLGCGTGVLGLIAYKRGATSVMFSDIDEGSVRTTLETCALNGYPSAQVLASDLLTAIPAAPVALVIANLSADLLLLVAEDAKLSNILPHGLLLMSGIAQNKRLQVEQAFHTIGFKTITERSEAWWNSLLLMRE
jgi:ribosomal protein L11 methyltransferase